jgi:Hemerythrin HHE cation binding domain
MGADDAQRVTAFSVQLRRAHQQLRDQLAALGADLGRPAAPANLTGHCLAFCAALTTHHQGEDDGMFGALLRARPDLAPAVEKLREDHAAMAALLGEARALAERARAAPAESLPALRRQFDGLTAITESHFRYEERAIGAALDDGVADTGWSAPVFRPADG